MKQLYLFITLIFSFQSIASTNFNSTKLDRLTNNEDLLSYIKKLETQTNTHTHTLKLILSPYTILIGSSNYVWAFFFLQNHFFKIPILHPIPILIFASIQSKYSNSDTLLHEQLNFQTSANPFMNLKSKNKTFKFKTSWLWQYKYKTKIIILKMTRYQRKLFIIIEVWDRNIAFCPVEPVRATPCK